MDALSLFAFGDLVFDVGLRRVTKRGITVELEPQEFKHLSLLALNALESDEKKVLCATYVCKLRKKLVKADSIVQIENVHGLGYRLISVPIEFVPRSKQE